MFRLLLLLLVGAALAVWLFGVRVFVVPPIGALPPGVTLIVANAPGLQLVDSADAMCARTMGYVTVLCRGMGLAAMTKTTSFQISL